MVQLVHRSLVFMRRSAEAPSRKFYQGEPVGNSVKAYLVGLSVLLLAIAAVAFDFVDFASACAALAKIVFVVVPVVFVVSTAVGLVARRRA